MHKKPYVWARGFGNSSAGRHLRVSLLVEGATNEQEFERVDVLDVLRICLRRWFVVLPLIILALGAGFGLARQQKPTYTAFASYALVFHNPGTSSLSDRDPTERNPLATNGAALLGEALVADFMSGPSQREFGGVGNRGIAPGQTDDNKSSYSVSHPHDSEAYLVQTWGKDPEGVRRVVDSVLAAAPARAAAIQDRAGAPRRSHYTVFVTSTAQVAELPPTSKVKFLVAVLGLGILAGCALALVVDRFLRSRKERWAAEVVPAALQPAKDTEFTNSANVPSPHPAVLHIPPIFTEPPSITEETVDMVIESSGRPVRSPTGATSVAQSRPAELEYEKRASQGRGDPNHHFLDKPAMASGSTHRVKGAGRISERNVETWNQPPWVGEAAHEANESGNGAEVHSRANMRVISSMPLDDSRDRDQQASPANGERPDEVNNIPGQVSAVGPAHTGNDTESTSETQIGNHQFI